MVYRLHCYLGILVQVLGNLRHHQLRHHHLRLPKDPRHSLRKDRRLPRHYCHQYHLIANMQHLHHCQQGHRHNSRRRFLRITLEWYGSSIL